MKMDEAATDGAKTHSTVITGEINTMIGNSQDEGKPQLRTVEEVPEMRGDRC